VKVLGPNASTSRPYVPGILAEGRFVFVSGQIPARDGVLVDGPIEDQTEAALTNLSAVLSIAGASLHDVIHCGVFLADLNDLPRFNAAYERAFGGHLPTRTAVGATLPGYGVEIDCVAVLPEP
jgi:2-iminobutanoate/2-iminopropanoate deaminase